MRLFFAIELPERLQEALSETSARLRDGVRGRYVAPDSFHVTLAFLGEVMWTDAEALGTLLEAVAGRHPVFDATLGPLGTFGRARRATLWQGFAAGGDEMRILAEDLRGELRRAGYGFDSKTFLPHVTLMRVADVTGGVLPMPAVATSAIARVALLRSDLTGPRPVYEALHVATLAP